MYFSHSAENIAFFFLDDTRIIIGHARGREEGTDLASNVNFPRERFYRGAVNGENGRSADGKRPLNCIGE